MKTAIQILDEMIEEHKKYDGRGSSLVSQRISALEAAKERIQKETGWIRVEDRRPKINQEIDYTDGISVWMGHYNGFPPMITHWMERPLPPSE